MFSIQNKRRLRLSQEKLCNKNKWRHQILFSIRINLNAMTNIRYSVQLGYKTEHLKTKSIWIEKRRFAYNKFVCQFIQLQFQA